MGQSLTPDRMPISQKEREVLQILHAALGGERTQAAAARLLDKSIRQVRRIQRRLQADGEAALVHGLRGTPSNSVSSFFTRQAVPLHLGILSLRPWWRGDDVKIEKSTS
jgi:hypothetical protein